MSRWKSPQVAARHAKRAAKAAGQLRREKRNSRLLIIGVALASISLMFGDYLWLRARARQRREQHMQSRHRSARTNATANATPGTGGTNSPETP